MFSNTNLYLTADLKISDVVFDNPRILLLLEHFGIYFPLQEKTISEICRENKLNPEVFLAFANLYYGTVHAYPVAFSHKDTQSIISFLKNGHHYYLLEKFPDIRQNLLQLYEANHEREISMVEKFFNEYFNEVTEHLKYEDEVVFPYIASLYQQILMNKSFEEPVSYSVEEYKEHHNDIEEKLSDLNNLLVKYLPRKDDQKIRRRLILCLSELEYDLTIHANIEDLILIPLVERMELELKTRR